MRSHALAAFAAFFISFSASASPLQCVEAIAPQQRFLRLRNAFADQVMEIRRSESGPRPGYLDFTPISARIEAGLIQVTTAFLNDADVVGLLRRIAERARESDATSAFPELHARVLPGATLGLGPSDWLLVKYGHALRAFSLDALAERRIETYSLPLHELNAPPVHHRVDANGVLETPSWRVSERAARDFWNLLHWTPMLWPGARMSPPVEPYSVDEGARWGYRGIL